MPESGAATGKVSEASGGQAETVPLASGQLQGVAILGQPRLRVQDRLARHRSGIHGASEFGNEFLGEGDLIPRGQEIELECVEFHALDLGDDLAGLDRLPRYNGYTDDPPGQPGARERVVPPRCDDRCVGQNSLLDRLQFDFRS